MNELNSVTRKAATVGAGLSAALLSSMASAQAATFDSAGIITNIGVYVAAGTLLIGTMIAAGWALHSLGLLKKK